MGGLTDEWTDRLRGRCEDGEAVALFLYGTEERQSNGKMGRARRAEKRKGAEEEWEKKGRKTSQSV